MSGLTFSSHARLPKDASETLRNLYELRQAADYDGQNSLNGLNPSALSGYRSSSSA